MVVETRTKEYEKRLEYKGLTELRRKRGDLIQLVIKLSTWLRSWISLCEQVITL